MKAKQSKSLQSKKSKKNDIHDSFLLTDEN
jgi:hypothetical protein